MCSRDQAPPGPTALRNQLLMSLGQLLAVACHPGAAAVFCGKFICRYFRPLCATDYFPAAMAQDLLFCRATLQRQPLLLLYPIF
jgi:hypothetical protein